MSIFDLPIDILIDVLLRLPVRSLLRCKCVCKRICSLIENPYFIDRHLNGKTTDGSNSYLLSTYSSYETRDHLLLSSIDNTNFMYSVSRLSTNFTAAELTIIGSCNGIVCIDLLAFNTSTILLWNPLMSPYKILPKPQIDETCSELSSILEFGFATEGNDYKVLRTVFSYKLPQDIFVLQVEVYKFSTDSWTIIEGKIPCYVNNTVSMEVDPILPLEMCSNSCPVLLKGAFHWVVIDPREVDEPCCAIVSFNLNDERLRLVTVLSSDKFPFFGDGTLAVIDESLTLTLSRFGEIHRGFDIWVMSEYGVEESWTKRFSIEPFPIITWPVGYWKDGLMIMQENRAVNERVTFFYDLNTRERKDFFDMKYFCVTNLFNFVESLVPVNRGNEVVDVADLL